MFNLIGYLILFFSVTLHAQDKNIEILKEKLVLAARAEYNYLKNDFKPDDQDVCEKKYLEILLIVSSVSDEDKFNSGKFYSRVYDRIAWYMFKNSKKLNLREISELFTLSLKLCDKNYFGLYKASEFYKGRNIKLHREYLLRAFENKDNLPEVLRNLPINFYDKDARNKVYSKNKKFIENLANYMPELYYFDNGFPNEKWQITSAIEDGKSFTVQRLIKYKESDNARFELIELE